MKKNKILLILLCVISSSLFAQENQEDKNKAADIANKLLSGNSKDVLYSYLQLAAKDLFGNNKSVEMNTTLFDLKRKGNPNLLIDKNFIKEKFSRNFAFNFKLNVDSAYKFNSFTGGFTYAFINERDDKLVNFAESRTKAGEMVLATVSEIQTEIETLTLLYLRNHAGDTAATRKASEALDNFHATQKLDLFPTDLRNSFEKAKLQEKYATYIQQAKAAYAEINKGWLCTFAMNASTNKANNIERGTAELTFLKGFDPEVDFKNKLTYYDTLTDKTVTRIILNSSLGANFPLFTTEEEGTKTNIAEFKLSAEYKNVLKNAMPGENDNNFMASGELRIRITKEIWLPFTIKYDIKNSNFLGFINVTFNSNAFKSSSKKSK